MRIFNRRNNNGSNTTESNALMQTGWGVIAYNTSSNAVTQSVTFPSTYTSAPIVVMVFGGDNGSSQTYGSGGNNIIGPVVAKAHSVTTTGFVAQFNTPNNGNFLAGYGFYQWVAIGV